MPLHGYGPDPFGGDSSSDGSGDAVEESIRDFDAHFDPVPKARNGLSLAFPGIVDDGKRRKLGLRVTVPM